MKKLLLHITIFFNKFELVHSITFGLCGIFKSNGVDHPASGDVTFDCYITARPVEIKTQADFWFDYYESYSGFIQCNVGNFTSPWSTGEYLHIDAIENSTGDTDSKDFLLTNAGYDYFAGIDDGMVLIREPPLSITLSSFTATYSSEALNICWITQSENNNSGWNVYRSESEYDEAIQLNGELIAGAGTTSEPTEYSFADEYQIEMETTYNYWLVSRDYDGLTETFGPVSLIVPQPDEDDPDNLENEELGLFQNVPNPLENSTYIRFSLKESADCKLSIYNIKGQVIRTYKAIQESNGKILWNGKDKNGNVVVSGIYFYKLEAGNRIYIKKMVKIR